MSFPVDLFPEVMDFLLTQPAHFQWVYVTNLPEDPNVYKAELMKYGRIKEFFDFPARQGLRHAMALLPDIDSSRKFESDVNEQYIRGHKVHTARWQFQSDLKALLAVAGRKNAPQVRSVGTMTDDVLPSVLEALEQGSVVNAEPSTSAIKPLVGTREEPVYAPDLLNTSAISDWVPSTSSRLPPIQELFSQRASRNCKTKSMMPTAGRAVLKSAPKTASISAKRAPPDSEAKENAKKAKKEVVKPNGKPERPTFACNRDGCFRNKKPYVLQNAYLDHMEKHRLDELEGEKADVGSPRSVRSCSVQSVHSVVSIRDARKSRKGG